MSIARGEILILPRRAGCRGLEQETALPRDSYLQPYYADVYGQLRVGPPLLFVLRGLNLSRGAPDVDAVCSTSGCDDGSFLNQVQSCTHLCPDWLQRGLVR